MVYLRLILSKEVIELKRVSLKELINTKPDKSNLLLIIDSSFKRDRDSAFIILEDNYYEMNKADHKDIIEEISEDNYFQLRELRQGIDLEETDLKFVTGHILDNQVIIDSRTIINYQIVDILEILLDNNFNRIFIQNYDNKNLLKEIYYLGKRSDDYENRIHK